MRARNIVSVIIIVIAAVLTVPAGLAAWQEREVENEDRFVDTVMEAFDQEQVQEAIALRMTAVIMERADVSDRIANGLETLVEGSKLDLPDGTILLQGPLTNVAREAIYRASLRLLQSDKTDAILETALRASHRVLMAAIDDDFEVLRLTNDAVILDLGALLDQIVLELAPERGQAFLDRLDLPEDAGQIVLLERNDPPLLWAVLEYLQFSFPWVPIVTFALLALAVAIAPNRRRMLIFGGSLIAGITFLTLWLISEPFQSLAADSIAQTPDGEAALKDVYDVLVDSFKMQQVVVIIVCMAVVVIARILGDKELVAAIRRSPESPGLGAWVRQRATMLRIFGLAIGAFFLLAWPDASNRLMLTVVGLLALYLLALWMATSDADWAVKSRERLSDFRSKLSTPEYEGGKDRSFAGVVARHAMLLRIIGVVVGVGAFMVWPSPGVGVMLAIVGLGLLYMALIDLIASRRPADPAG